MILDHKHLLIRAECERIPGRDFDLKVKLEELVDLIDMKILAGPMTAWCDMPGNIGWSGTTIIETSHIAWHSWNESGLLNLDIYSCKPFDPHKVIAWADVFKPTHMEYKFLDRNTKFATLEQDTLEFDH